MGLGNTTLVVSIVRVIQPENIKHIPVFEAESIAGPIIPGPIGDAAGLCDAGLERAASGCLDIGWVACGLVTAWGARAWSLSSPA